MNTIFQMFHLAVLIHNNWAHNTIIDYLYLIGLYYNIQAFIIFMRNETTSNDATEDMRNETMRNEIMRNETMRNEIM